MLHFIPGSCLETEDSESGEPFSAGAASLPDPHPDTPELLSLLSVIGVPRHGHSHTGRGNALFSRFPSPFVYKRGSFRNLDGKEF